MRIKRKTPISIVIIVAIVFVCILQAYVIPSFKGYEGEMLVIYERSNMLSVAHSADFDGELMGKTVNMTVTMKRGELVLTDITNGNTYTGSYRKKFTGRILRNEYVLELEGESGYIEFPERSLKKRLMSITVGNYRMEFLLD